MNLRMNAQNGIVQIDTDGTVLLNYYQALIIRDSLDEMIERVRPKTEMTAEQIEEQKQSWARGMTARCEHGKIDFEQCPKCRGWE